MQPQVAHKVAYQPAGFAIPTSISSIPQAEFNLIMGLLLSACIACVNPARGFNVFLIVALLYINLKISQDEAVSAYWKGISDYGPDFAKSERAQKLFRKVTHPFFRSPENTRQSGAAMHNAVGLRLPGTV
ncbi:MAG: hypothetical protein A3F18_02310 [Legionellales bacterium RIFCSPHIGHO2_12_FULL_37_14]|nr:MAG: hypothetical protein A3F18_02310 [Legionellales bacterium RIFCSPHIGHO2_12_FULL_37_14]